MCGRYILVQKIEKLEKRFNVSASEDVLWEPSYNISIGKQAPVITSENPEKLQVFTFGLTPFWATKPMYLFNARAEGNRNKDNDVNYRGSKDIINRPAFRKPIRNKRCLIPADAFIEGTTQNGLDEPYLVYLKDKQRPFAFAGIYDEWLNKETGEIIRGFSIITTTANRLIQKIPHHRSPVILSPNNEKSWLNPKTQLTDITSLLNPFPSEKMNAYPIDNAIKNPANDFPELIKINGEQLFDESENNISDSLKRSGFGRNKRHF
jgi:putative SOS response-associated peptidase YedK